MKTAYGKTESGESESGKYESETMESWKIVSGGQILGVRGPPPRQSVSGKESKMIIFNPLGKQFAFFDLAAGQ